MAKAKGIEDLWSHIHWLGALASAGSYTAAAQRLQVSKAAVSQRIAELEQVAGVPLVRRTTRSVRLTEAGQRLVDDTREAFEHIGQSFAGVKDLAGAPRGVLNLTAPVALGRQAIVPLIPAYLREHPQVRIELELSDRVVPLATEGFDLAVRHVAEAPDTHVAWELCDTHSLLVATPEYLARQGQPRHPTDLVRHDCLRYLRRSAAPHWRFEPAEGGDPVSVEVQGSFTANNSEALREAALGHLGIALLPDFSAAAELRSGRLVQVLPGWCIVGGFANRILAVRPYGAQVPRTVTTFVAHLRAALAGGFETGGR